MNAHRLALSAFMVVAVLAALAVALPAHADQPFHPGWRAERQGGDVVRWDPCSGPITYSVDYGHARLRAGRMVMDDWTWALRRAERASGLRFVQVSTYDRAQVRVRWRDFAGDPAIKAEETTRYVPLGHGVAEAVGATILVRPWHDQGRRAMLLHELGHLVGLGHVNDPRSLMYPSTTHHRAQYARGDLRGLWTLGAGGGCLPTWP